MRSRGGTGFRLGLALPLGLLAGCHHHTRATYATSPPALGTHGIPPVKAGAGFFDDTTLPANYSETGLATWYYAHGHKGSDGILYGAEAPTAAHKTLPLGSTVRVTNIQTGQSTFVRITDRGPFVPGRVLDLSEVAAKQIGLYRIGVAQVRVEAFPHPNADPLGRWCVQTGPFQTVQDALDLKSALTERYRGSRVAEFTGSTGFWVRIDPPDRGRTAATQIAKGIGSPDARTNSFLVRVN